MDEAGAQDACAGGHVTRDRGADRTYARCRGRGRRRLLGPEVGGMQGKRGCKIRGETGGGVEVATMENNAKHCGKMRGRRKMVARD